jgi:hypothetical protein
MLPRLSTGSSVPAADQNRFLAPRPENGYRTRVLERSDPFDALFAPHSGLFHAAERGAQIESRGTVIIDPDIPANELIGDTTCASFISAPNRGAQTRPIVIRQVDSVIFVFKSDDWQDRTKLLLGYDASKRVSVNDEGGAYEVSVLEIRSLR